MSDGIRHLTIAEQRTWTEALLKSATTATAIAYICPVCGKVGGGSTGYAMGCRRTKRMLKRGCIAPQASEEQ